MNHPPVDPTDYPILLDESKTSTHSIVKESSHILPQVFIQDTNSKSGNVFNAIQLSINQ